MGFAASPFTLEPVRSNEFKEAQISKEIHSLTTNIENIKKDIEIVRRRKERNDAIEREKLEMAKKRVESVRIPQSGGDGSKGENSESSIVEKKTSHFYRTSGLPERFERPDKWNYHVKKEHPSYTTTTNVYGSKIPTIHEMPTTFKGQSSKFSVSLDRAGPYRNFSLNI